MLIVQNDDIFLRHFVTKQCSSLRSNALPIKTKTEHNTRILIAFVMPFANQMSFVDPICCLLILSLFFQGSDSNCDQHRRQQEFICQVTNSLVTKELCQNTEIATSHISVAAQIRCFRYISKQHQGDCEISRSHNIRQIPRCNPRPPPYI